MATISPIRQRMIEDMTIRNLSRATQLLISMRWRGSADISIVHQIGLGWRKFAPTNCTLSAETIPGLTLIRSHLRFFYGITLGQKEAFERIVNGREPEKLPSVLGAEEIAQFLAAVAGLRNRVALTTSYGRLKQMAHGLFFMRTSRTATSSGNNACHVAPRHPLWSSKLPMRQRIRIPPRAMEPSIRP